MKGPYDIYLRDQVVSYFMLIGKTRPEIKDNTDDDGKNNFILFKLINTIDQGSKLYSTTALQSKT